MTKHFEQLANYEQNGFEIIVDKTWEDIPVADCFDDTVTDLEEIRWKIEHGDLDWFMLRVRVFFEGHEMGSHYLGGFLYEDAKEVLVDGTAADCIEAAMEEAKQEIERLRQKLADLVV